MRVALVVAEPGSAGAWAGQRLLDAAVALRAAGVEAELVTGGAVTRPPEGIAIRVIDPRRPDPGSARYDVVHAFGLRGLRIAEGIGPTGHRVFSPHGERWFQPSQVLGVHRARPRLGALLAASVDTIVCRSHLEATRMRRHAPEISDRLRVVQAGIDVEAFRRAEPLPINRAVILALGPVDLGARAIRVVGALAGLDERFVLVVLGDGPARRRMRGIVDALRLGNRVRFLGAVTLDERRRWMNTAAVLVPMSPQEDVETLALEAAAIDTPVVVPDCAEQAGGFGSDCGAVVRVISGPSSPLAIADAIRETAVLHRPTPSAAGVRSWADHAEELLTVYRHGPALSAVAAPAWPRVEPRFRSGRVS